MKRTAPIIFFTVPAFKFFTVVEIAEIEQIISVSPRAQLFRNVQDLRKELKLPKLLGKLLVLFDDWITQIPLPIRNENNECGDIIRNFADR